MRLMMLPSNVNGAHAQCKDWAPEEDIPEWIDSRPIAAGLSSNGSVLPVLDIYGKANPGRCRCFLNL
jgi:hypothetical protein